MVYTFLITLGNALNPLIRPDKRRVFVRIFEGATLHVVNTR